MARSASSAFNACHNRRRNDRTCSWMIFCRTSADTSMTTSLVLLILVVVVAAAAVVVVAHSGAFFFPSWCLTGPFALLVLPVGLVVLDADGDDLVAGDDLAVVVVSLPPPAATALVLARLWSVLPLLVGLLRFTISKF